MLARRYIIVTSTYIQNVGDLEEEILWNFEGKIFFIFIRAIVTKLLEWKMKWVESLAQKTNRIFLFKWLLLFRWFNNFLEKSWNLSSAVFRCLAYEVTFQWNMCWRDDVYPSSIWVKNIHFVCLIINVRALVFQLKILI